MKKSEFKRLSYNVSISTNILALLIIIFLLIKLKRKQQQTKTLQTQLQQAQQSNNTIQRPVATTFPLPLVSYQTAQTLDAFQSQPPNINDRRISFQEVGPTDHQMHAQVRLQFEGILRDQLQLERQRTDFLQQENSRLKEQVENQQMEIKQKDSQIERHSRQRMSSQGLRTPHNSEIVSQYTPININRPSQNKQLLPVFPPQIIQISSIRPVEATKTNPIIPLQTIQANPIIPLQTIQANPIIPLQTTQTNLTNYIPQHQSSQIRNMRNQLQFCQQRLHQSQRSQIQLRRKLQQYQRTSPYFLSHPQYHRLRQLNNRYKAMIVTLQKYLLDRQHAVLFKKIDQTLY